MSPSSDMETVPPAPEPGLRTRKKAQRRKTILDCARTLFNRDGIDQTTMAAIADAAHVSPPTVFNYFGTKENILSALLFEGTEAARNAHLRVPFPTNRPFAQVLGDQFCIISENTMGVAGKRIWRYGESAAIRRQGSDFQRQFRLMDNALRDIMKSFLDFYAIGLRSSGPVDTTFLTALLFDRWTARYLEYIHDDDMPFDVHTADLRADAQALVELLFDPEFAATSPVAKTETPA